MDTLWSDGPDLSVRDVMDRMEARGEKELAYTTVMTVLDRLAKKGLVHRERDGRAYRYAPAHTRDELVADVMHTALEGDTADRTAALVAFVNRVSPDEATALREALAQLEARHDSGRG